MNREDMLANLTSTLEAWYREHTVGEPQANVISAGIIVLHHMERTFPSHGSALGSWLQWRFRLTQRPRLRNTAIVTVKDFPGFGRVLLP